MDRQAGYDLMVCGMNNEQAAISGRSMPARLIFRELLIGLQSRPRPAPGK